MRPPNWLRIGKPRREGNEVVYPLSVDIDGLMSEDSIREGQRRLQEAGWTAEEFAEGLRRAVEASGIPTERSDDPDLGPDAARWKPEDGR